MAKQKTRWKKFHTLTKFDSRRFSRRMKKAEGVTLRHARKFIVGRLDSIRSVRRHVIGWLTLVGVLIVAVAAQFVWFQHSYQTTAAATGGTYAEGVLGPIGTLNPLYASTSAELSASKLIFSSLYSYDTTGHLRGDLAESMTIDSSQTTYTVKLRPDVYWHDGTRLTANDVAYTVDLIKNPQVQARPALSVSWRSVTAKVIDDRTVEFKLPVIYAAFPHALTFAVLPQHALEGVAPAMLRENTFSQAPIGSGPFIFRVLQSTDTAGTEKIVSLAANKQYYGGAPRIGHFDLHAYASQDHILQALRSGEVSAATDVTPSDPSQVDAHNYVTSARPINDGVYAIFNTATATLKDKAVRQALRLGVDTSAIRHNLPLTPPALDLPFIDGQVTASDMPHAPKADPAKAAADLDAAGWKLDGNVRKKDGQELTLSVVTTKNPQYEKALDSLANQWRALGVKVNAHIIDTSDPTANFFQDTIQQRNYDVLLYELEIGADPDVYSYWHSSQLGTSGYNLANYSNPAADAALVSARARLEPELRAVKYRAFARQWLDDAPAIGLYQAVMPYIANRSVTTTNSTAHLVGAQDRYTDILNWNVQTHPVYKTP